MGSNDLELLARYVKGEDPEALVELADRHRDMVYATCYRLLGDRADAEDAAQECFLQLARHGAAVRGSVVGWLHRVATRTSIAVRRKNRTRRQAEREAESIVSAGAAEPTWEELRIEIDSAIDRLPDELRETVVLRFLEGKTQTEIAGELGVSQPAVSMRLSKALKQLRKHLGRLGLGLSAAGLATLLETHAAEAAPATLIANLGRVALAGPSGAPTGGLATSVLNPLASMGPGSKALSLLAVALTVGAVVQQVTQAPPAANGRPAVQQALAAPRLSIPEAAPSDDARADSQDEPRRAGATTAEPRSGHAAGPASRLPATPSPGRPSPVARRSAPLPEAPAGGTEAAAGKTRSTYRTERPPSAGRPTGDVRTAQAGTTPEGIPQDGETVGEPPAPRLGALVADGASVYFSPTGFVTIVDQDGVVATLGIMAFGKGWDPRDQRRALRGFPVPDEPGWVGFEGEVMLWGTGGNTLLYVERVGVTDGVVEVEYDVTFSAATQIQGFSPVLEFPRQRFAGDAVTVRAGGAEQAIIDLPPALAGYRIGTAEGEQIAIGPYAQPVLSVSVVEQDVPLPLQTRFPVLDLRPFDIDNYSVNIGGTMAAGQDVSPATYLPVTLLLEFPDKDIPPTLIPPGMIERPGVRLCYDGRVEGPLCERIADVVSAAKQACEELLPDLAKEEIRVCAVPVASWRDNIATNRHDTIYLRMRDGEFGEAMRADAGPVGMLCQAVAELYNPDRFPGLDRFIAHRHLVRAVVDELGAEILPGIHATHPATDGPEMLALLTGDTYAPVHPDFAAARALAAIEDELGFEGLCALAREIPADMQPDFAGFRAAAVARDPALAEAFEAYDVATDIEFGEDGAHLMASFEADETIRTVSAHPLHTVTDDLVVMASPEFEGSQSDEWAAHGTQSLRLHAGKPQAGMYVAIADPDWQFRDWQRLSGLEMDLMVEAPTTQQLRVLLMDDIGGAHAQMPLYRGTVQPGERLHISETVQAESMGQRQLESECYNWGFRAGDVALLHIDLPHPTSQPVTLYIDNIRLTPRGAGHAGDGGAQPLAAPAAGGAPGEVRVFGGAFSGFRPPAAAQPKAEGSRGFRGGDRGEPQPTAGEAAGQTGAAVAWEFDTGLGCWIRSPAIGPDGTLYTGSEDDNVYALDPRTGDLKWTFATGGIVSSAPAVAPDGTVYVGSWDWNVYALDGATGARKWEFRTDGRVINAPALADDGTVYVGGGRFLYALNGTTGEPVWTTRQNSIQFGSPALSSDGRLVYAGLCYHPNTGLYALNAQTGEREWWYRTEYEHHEYSTPAVGQDGTVYFGSADDRVYAFESATGELKWEFVTGRDATDPAIGPDGTVYAWSSEGHLYAVDPATGEQLAEYPTEKWTWVAVGADGTVYAGCEMLVALDRSLHLLWEFDDGATDFPRPTIGPDGTIYAGSSLGKVYAIR